MRTLLLFLFCLGSMAAFSQQFPTLFEQSGGRQSPTYGAIIDWWKKLDAASPVVRLKEMGLTDAGYPLHLLLVSADRNFEVQDIGNKPKSIIFINNGIHPGEPDGIDASMLLVRDIATGKYRLPANIMLAIIPVYNVGGALNRSPNYRVDQDGPEEKGFRGNAQNLDLNRDFIKCDSRNALAFTRIFRWLDPDVFIDNHVSNGADYQHVMTLLTSQHSRLGGAMGAFMHDRFEPALYKTMKTKGFDLVPYVNHFGDTPEKGWNAFWDSPRYSSGYTSLWHTFSFTPETHMLKPYPQRVAATKALMESIIAFTAANGDTMRKLRQEARIVLPLMKTYPLGWKLDRSIADTIVFKGYESAYTTSAVSGLQIRYYDRSKPFEKRVPFHNTYRDTFSIEVPQAYVIPQGWWKVIERLQANGIRMRRLTRDTLIEVESYKILSYTAAPRPFEGHHPNRDVKVAATVVKKTFRKGDYFIPIIQNGARFLMETLEPQGEDSYFTWNFFDPILGQKEGFSDYVFEETAAALLKKDTSLLRRLEDRRRSDSTFARSAGAQLNFVYQHSKYMEPDFMQYPVYRVR